ncbi:MAG: G8 domain-containing protein [Burkholderiaceae bacterium]
MPPVTVAPLPGTTSNWSDPATWGGQLPDAAASVMIPAGRTVVLDRDVQVANLRIEGALTFDRKNLNLSANWILVAGNGILRIGEPTSPFTQKAVITLTANNPAEDILGMGTKFIGATGAGKLELFGESRVNWTKLGATATPGATQIKLMEAVDWRVGERIAIGSTALDPYQSTERAITAVSADRLTVTLDAALTSTHFGQLQTFEGKVLDARAPVALLSRNIVIQGNAESTAAKFGGHVMVMAGASAKVSGVEFVRMGQFDRLGRYPFHWHIAGDRTGDFITGSSVRESFQRGIVVHSTSNTIVRNNVVWNTVGHHYATEIGDETGNLFDRNLGLLTKPFPRDATDPTQRGQNDTQAATFWIRGPHNKFIGNHAGGGDHTGFWFDNVGKVDQAKFEFRGNTAHSYLIDGKRNGEVCCSFEKAALWFTGDGFDTPYRGPFPVSELTLFKNRVAMWGNPLTVGQGFSDVRLSDSILADNIMGLNSHGAKNTVIVGASANTDAYDNIGSSGVQEYGHTQKLENVTFVNFSNGGAAIQHRNCAREAGNVTATGVKLVNAKINMCGYTNNPNVDLAIADVGGTMLGNGVPVTLTPAAAGSRAMYTIDCALNAAQGVRVCNGLLGYSNLHLRGSSATLARDDGVVLDNSDVTTYPFYWTTIEGRRYSLNGDVAAQPTLEFSFFGKYEDDDRHRTVVVSIPASTAFAIYAQDANWFSEGAANRNGIPLLPQATSLAALNSSTASTYFYDSAAKTIYLKLSTAAANRVYVDRR